LAIAGVDRCLFALTDAAADAALRSLDELAELAAAHVS